MDSLIHYLQFETDFFSSPASTRFHGAHEGGLVEHSLEVYKNLLILSNSFGVCLEPDSAIICALLHDVCKANFYKRGFRNKKNDSTGQWEKIEVYEIEDQLPLGHGEKSVMLLQQFIRLSPEEMMAIRWHMGGFDDAAHSYSGARCLSSAMQKSPLVAILHMADIAASHLQNK